MSIIQSVLSLVLMWHLWLLGKKHVNAWLVGIIYQWMWIGYILATKQYGLLLAAIPVTILCIVNDVRWRFEL